MDRTKPISSPGPATPVAERALGAGVRVGAFELQAVIAESPGSIVYLARDPALETQVAIKEYMPERLAQREAGRVVALPEHAEAYRRGLRAFHAAARTIARIDHPASPRALLLWEANATAYLAMPYYPGTTLLELRRGMRQAPDEASLRALLDGLLGALDAYHRRDIIHGDVSPSKILLLPDDRPLLLGPGSPSARLATGAADRGAPFAAPEQRAPSPDAPLGPWTDLYALAAVLRFCITGQLTNASRLEEAGAGDGNTRLEAEAGDGRPVYSAALRQTLEAALSPQWERRPQSAQQFREWLERAPQLAGAPDKAAPVAETDSLPVRSTTAAAGTSGPTTQGPELAPGLQPARGAAEHAARAATTADRRQVNPVPEMAAASGPAAGTAPHVSPQRAPAEPQRESAEPRIEPRSEPRTEPEVPPVRRTGVFTSPPRASAKAQATLGPQRREPARDKTPEGEGLREAAWLEQRRGLAPIEPGFDFDPGRIAPGDGHEEFAWRAAGGSRRRRREVLLGSALLIVLAIGVALFATNAWKSMLPAHVEMDPAARQPAQPPPGTSPGTKDGATPSQQHPPAAAPASPQQAPGARPQSGAPVPHPAPIETRAVHSAAALPAGGDPFPAPAAAPPLGASAETATPAPSAQSGSPAAETGTLKAGTAAPH